MRPVTWSLVFSILILATILTFYVSERIPRVVIDAAILPSYEVMRTRGEYLSKISGCNTCHAVNGDSRNLSGGLKITTKFGEFYSTNISPDKRTGIGNWELEDFVRAMRYGMSPVGTHYYPVFPYTSYSKMSDVDLVSLFRYLQSLPAVSRLAPEHDTAWYVWRGGLRVWKRFGFKPGALVPDPLASADLNNGRYLAEAVAHCSECHSPRDGIGRINPVAPYSGGTIEIDGEVAPNITTSRRHGIGRWNLPQLRSYLSTGMGPDEGLASKQMGMVISGSTSELEPRDLEDLSQYIMQLPALDK